MRKCLRCGAEMVEDWKVVVEMPRDLNEIIVTNGKSFLKGDGRQGTMRAAVCPQCGEISVYVDDPNTVINGWR